LHFLVGEHPLQGCWNGWNRFAPDSQRRIMTLAAGVEVALQAWIQGREVRSVVSSATLPALERAAKRRLCRSQPRPQIEHVLQLDPAFLARADVDRLRGLRELGEFPETVRHPGPIANDPTVLPHQI